MLPLSSKYFNCASDSSMARLFSLFSAANHSFSASGLAVLGSVPLNTNSISLSEATPGGKLPIDCATRNASIRALKTLEVS